MWILNTFIRSFMLHDWFLTKWWQISDMPGQQWACQLKLVFWSPNIKYPCSWKYDLLPFVISAFLIAIVHLYCSPSDHLALVQTADIPSQIFCQSYSPNLGPSWAVKQLHFWIPCYNRMPLRQPLGGIPLISRLWLCIYFFLSTL